MILQLSKRLDTLESKQKENTTENPWVTLTTAAKQAGSSRRTLERDMQKGILNGVKSGARWKFKLSEVNAYIVRKSS